ncbi:MAG: DNA translocase FtsK 4TM domain-containing protein [Rhodospirillales bacterium]|nr:DNA translocase FtsK 4TM domain-containing protein [Rhodospirillales bacterium]
MVATAAREARTPLLPSGSGPFFARRLSELAGLALTALAAVIAVALASHSAADPSFNSASSNASANLIGRPGACGADLLLQWFGLAAALVPAILAAWAWALLSHRGLNRRLVRFALAPLSILLAAVGGASVGIADWPTAAGAGGAAGKMVLSALGPLELDGLDFGGGSGMAAAGVGAVFLIVAAVALVFALGVPWREWRALFRGVYWLLRHTVGASVWVTRAGHGGSGDRAVDVGDDEEVAPARRPRRLARSAEKTTRRREPSLLPPVPGEIEERPAKPGIVEKPRRRVKPGKREKKERQPTLDLEDSTEYTLPALALLADADGDNKAPNASEDALRQNAEMLVSVLEDFRVFGEITQVRPGPVVTLYELEPQPGTRTSRVIGLADDIARSMSAISVRAATIPGRSVIGIELPNSQRETVLLRELLASAAYESTEHSLTLALGKDIGGNPVVADLARMPHLLVAGTTGSGKSVAINSMILSLLYRLPPDQCKLILIDPKMLELSVYDDIPHLLTPVVTEPAKAVVALKWTVREMESRYKAMSKLGVRNISGYNKRLAEARAKGEQLTWRVNVGMDAETGAPIHEEFEIDLTPMPFIVVVVDEMADLMLVAGKDIEGAVQRLAQMARAAGIHLIMATQRPSVDVITGTIKANFPTRISFQVTSKIDSRTILGEAGAEQLLGQGDMLYLGAGGRVARVHGPFVSDAEVERVTDFLRANGRPNYIEGITEEPEATAAGIDEGGDEDPLYDRAVALVAAERKASTSFVQRHLQIGYNRAARIIERMESEGVVSQANHVGKREVLVSDHSAG